MSGKHVFRAVTLTLVATLITTTAIYAAPQGGPGRTHRWESRLQQRLGLTDDQLQTFRQLHASRDVEAVREQFRALRAAQAELRRLALNGADEATLAAKQAEIQTLRGQQLQRRVEALKQIGPVLTPEQREALARMMEHGHRGHHRDRPHGPRQQG